MGVVCVCVVLSDFLDKLRDTIGMIKDAIDGADWTGAKRWAVRLKYLVSIEDAIRGRAENAGQ